MSGFHAMLHDQAENTDANWFPAVLGIFRLVWWQGNPSLQFSLCVSEQPASMPTACNQCSAQCEPASRSAISVQCLRDKPRTSVPTATTVQAKRRACFIPFRVLRCLLESFQAPLHYWSEAHP
jgi:hypothetical protein